MLTRKSLLTTLSLGLIAMSSLDDAHAVSWLPLDTEPEGTEPTIELDPTSDPYQTILNVTLHGFYVEDLDEGGITFNRIGFNNRRQAAAYQVIGRPDLPTLKLSLGNPTGATTGTVGVTTLASEVFSGLNPYPKQPSALDNGDPPPPFEWDREFYEQTTSLFPSGDSNGFTSAGRFSGLDIAGVEIYPFQIIPATGELHVKRVFQVLISHAGTGSPEPRTLSRRLARHYEILLCNYPSMEPLMNVLTNFYAGEFLFVVPPEFEEEIQPLVDQKMNRGYDVDVWTTVLTGDSCEDIRASIANWWSLGADEADRYVILVGDSPQIPMCPGPFGNLSDLMYACIDGAPDPYPEIRLGRLPAGDEAELEEMVSKTLIYEHGYPFSGEWLGDVLLTAHEEDYPGKYTLAQEDVRNASYSVQPSFVTLYGGEGATNEQVNDRIETGCGIVGYRGHGSPNRWWIWNQAGESYENGDVASLENADRYPVVFSIACRNNGLPSNSIGETWLEGPGGAVAHYGAIVNSHTLPNHTLDYWLFQAIFESNQTILSEAIAHAEATMIQEHGADGEDNAWMYSLFGDPELKVWRTIPQPLEIVGFPEEVPVGPGDLPLQVLDENSRPLPMVLVSVPIHGENGEYGGSHYTDADGNVQIPIDASYFFDDGVVPVSAYTEFDDHGVDEVAIPIQGTSDASDWTPLPSEPDHEPPSPNPFQDQTTIRYTLHREGVTRVWVADPSGRLVTMLLDRKQRAGTHAISWNGLDGAERRAGSGVYWLIVESDGVRKVEKVVLRR